MKSQEKTRKDINKNKNSHRNRLSSLNEQFSSELKFIVPWVQLDHLNLEKLNHTSKN